MTGKLKLIISAAVIAACITAIALGCVLGLKKNGNGGNHVVTEANDGELSLSLVRERLDTVTLDAMGFHTPHADTASVDFSNSNANIFGINSNVLIGPRCSFTAWMVISNTAGYDFSYWLEIVPVGGEYLLAEQLELTVTVDGNQAVKRTLDNGLLTLPLATVKGGTQGRFCAKLEYLDVADNNQTQNVTLVFDMVVHAKLV